jgi:hypothetical protein
MTESVRRALAACVIYVSVLLVAASLLHAPDSAGNRLLLSQFSLLAPALAALFATTRAARGSVGGERAFWSLLAGAAAAQVTAVAAFLLQGTDIAHRPALLGLGHLGHYTFSVLVAVSVIVCPHRPVPAGRLRAAILEWTMAAVVVYFLIFYFVTIPLDETASSWSWIFTLEMGAIAAGFGLLAFTVRQPPFATVYRILAAGLAAGAVAGFIETVRTAAGSHDSVGSVHWVLILLALASAATAERGPVRVPGRDDADITSRRGWWTPAVVMLPLLVDLGSRVVQDYPAALAEARLEMALAATGILLVLTAIRVRGTSAVRFGDGGAPPSTSGSSEYVHFATGIAHELNNPLMAVGGWAELALRKSEPRESLEALLAATQRAAQSVRRLQQLGRAAEPATGLSNSPSDVSIVVGLPPAEPAGWTRWLVAGTALFAAAYFTLFLLDVPPWTGDALLVLPPAVAAIVLWRRGLRSRTPRSAAFWRLVAGGAATWGVGEVLWVAIEVGGGRPFDEHGGRALSVIFLGFLVPVLVALSLRAHPPIMRRDPATVPDSLFICVAVLYSFVHLVVLSAVGMTEPSATQRILLGTLWATTTAWAAVLWRAVDHPAWRRAYGAVALFALTYGTLRVFAIGVAGHPPEPGGWADVAWFLPFAILISAVGRGGAAATSAFPALLAAGAGPVILDLLLRQMRPSPSVAGSGPLHHLRSPPRRRRRRAPALAGRGGPPCPPGSPHGRRGIAARGPSDRSRVAGGGRGGRAGGPAGGGVSAGRGPRPSSCRTRASRCCSRRGMRATSSGAHECLLPRAPRPAPGHRPRQAARGSRRGGARRRPAPACQPRGPGRAARRSTAIRAPSPLRCRTCCATPPRPARGACCASGGAARRRGRALLHRRRAGCSRGLRGQIFDPFFTTRRVGDGVGLGLTLVHFVARGHGGSIVLEDAGRAPASPCACPRPRRRPTRETARRGPLRRRPSSAARWPSSWPSSRARRSARP